MTICILGRQPELGLAELESLYGSENVQLAGDQCALVDAPVDFARLGGSIKAGELLEILDETSRKSVFKAISKLLPDIVRTLPSEGKVKLGLSVYGFGISPYELNGEALRLKKSIKSLGRSVRVVPNEAPTLSSAQTYHNRLADELGIELLIIRDGDQTHVGRVTDVQDIDSYRIRDRERPKRDAFVGMLPPKLAQIIVNLAVGELEGRRKKEEGRESQVAGSRQSTESDPNTTSAIYLQPEFVEAPGPSPEPGVKPWSGSRYEGSEQTQDDGSGGSITVLDPFCGTGVVLQEAILMGYDAYGTDLSEKMISYSSTNLKWLPESRKIKKEGRIKLEKADATNHSWDLSAFNLQPSSFCVATETYLGQPLGGQQPSKEKFSEIVHDTNAVVRGFFENIAPQLPDRTRLCVAVPVWFYNGVTHLPVIQELASMGLMSHTFSHVVAPLMYHREDQITGRELLVLRKEHHEATKLISSS